jgi:hypothetical protein
MTRAGHDLATKETVMKLKVVPVLGLLAAFALACGGNKAEEEAAKAAAEAKVAAEKAAADAQKAADEAVKKAAEEAAKAAADAQKAEAAANDAAVQADKAADAADAHEVTGKTTIGTTGSTTIKNPNADKK